MLGLWLSRSAPVVAGLVVVLQRAVVVPGRADAPDPGLVVVS